MLAASTALILTFIIGTKVIDYLKKFQISGQPIRLDGPDLHIITKKGTPTMGGLIIVFCITISTLAWADLSNYYIWISLMVTLSFALLGLIDDYKKIKYSNSHGISAKQKIFWQLLISVIAVFYIQNTFPQFNTSLFVPFYKNFVLNLGIFYIIFAYLVIIGSSNAVNLTDGLDGLASLPLVLTACFFALISYLVGDIITANEFQLYHIENTRELTVFCSALAGACLGFLWYNAHPAKIFMGDVGSLSLGSAIGVVSVITKHEIALLISGGLFVIEAMSVIIQVFSFKIRRKRIFKMAPLHHHFEKNGWSESMTVIRFWIIAFVFTSIALYSLMH